MTQAVYLRLPKPTLDIIGWLDTAAISGSVTLTLPVFALATGNLEGGVLTLPKLVLQVAGISGVVAEVALQVRPTIAVAGAAGVIGGVQLALPSLGIEVRDPDTTILALPRLRIQAAGATGVVGSVSLRAPAPRVSAVGSVQFVANAALRILPRLAVAGNTGAVGGVAVALRRLALAAAGYTGTTGEVALTLPVFALGSAGTGPLIGTATLVLPMLRLEATGTTAASGNSLAFAMHLENFALTTYTNFGFNSFATFNGVYLGATDGGIFALTGASDAGVAIAAVARVGTSDFGTSKIKRIDRCYIGYKTDGSLELRAITDETTTRTYALVPTGKSGIHGNLVRIGKGVQARYWQFEIANVNGADFELNCIELKPNHLGRRVGGEDS